MNRSTESVYSMIFFDIEKIVLENIKNFLKNFLFFSGDFDTVQPPRIGIFSTLYREKHNFHTVLLWLYLKKMEHASKIMFFFIQNTDFFFF